jgi:putative (di)nucleoside polyphosphate hydrolase
LNVPTSNPYTSDELNTARSMNTLPLRPNVCMLVLNKDGLLLLGERNRAPDVWQFPQGGVEVEASLEDSVIRELTEELGVVPELLRIEHRLKATHDYDFAEVPSYAVGRWRGQSQTFWIVRFLGTDADIDLQASDAPEFTRFRWCTPDEVRRIADPRRLEGYETPLRELEQLYPTSRGASPR